MTDVLLYSIHRENESSVVFIQSWVKIVHTL